jgi:hypothetical protein
MNEGDSVNLEDRVDRRSAVIALTGRGSDVGLNEYNVRTGIDVLADGPSTAVLTAIKEMGLRDAEAFCYQVDHLPSGRRWNVEHGPDGEIEITDWDK